MRSKEGAENSKWYCFGEINEKYQIWYKYDEDDLIWQVTNKIPTGCGGYYRLSEILRIKGF